MLATATVEWETARASRKNPSRENAASSSIAHRVTVMHQGKVLAEGNMESVQSNPKVKEVYLGH